MGSKSSIIVFFISCLTLKIVESYFKCTVVFPIVSVVIFTILFFCIVTILNYTMCFLTCFCREFLIFKKCSITWGLMFESRRITIFLSTFYNRPKGNFRKWGSCQFFIGGSVKIFLLTQIFKLDKLFKYLEQIRKIHRKFSRTLWKRRFSSKNKERIKLKMGLECSDKTSCFRMKIILDGH